MGAIRGFCSRETVKFYNDKSVMYNGKRIESVHLCNIRGDRRSGDCPPTVETAKTDRGRIAEGPTVDKVADDIMGLVADDDRDGVLHIDGKRDRQFRYFRSKD